MDMSGKFVRLDIKDRASLMEACELLHDARCCLSTVEFDRNVGSWKASFDREFLEDPDLIESQPRLLIFAKRTYPFVSSEFVLKGLASYDLADNADIGTYTFNVCRIIGSSYEFWFNEGMKMILRFKDKPRGELRDLKVLPTKGSCYVFRNPFTSLFTVRS